MINGIILLDKPKGISSNSAVNKVKHMLNADKAGHLGTLDVLGHGLLPVTLGRSTKLFDFFLNKDKVYEANFRFGVETETFDLEGDITKTTTFEVTVGKPSLIEISVVNPKTSYLIGDTFVKPTVMALYGDAVEEDVTDLATFSGYDMSTAGVYTVTVSYSEGADTETTTYQITVNSTLESIAVNGQKVEFWVNDTFEFGGTVTAHYTNGDQKQITTGYYVDHSQVDMTTVGSYIVTVSYEENSIEKSTSYQVTVKKEVLASVSISGNTKTQFEVGDDFEFNGTVTATYESGKHYDVTGRIESGLLCI